MPSNIERPEIRMIKLDDLVIDKRYQRPLHEGLVAKIASDFKTVRCGALRVSSTNNGKYPVFDGQHRLAALQLLFDGQDEWPCEVYPLNAKQQAIEFVSIQTERRPVHPLDRHKASVFSGDDLAIKVDNLVTEAGYRITGNKVHGALSCVSGLYDCYRKYGAVAIREALRVIDEAWGLDDHLARKAPMVTGMILLLAKYPKNEVDREALVEKLRATSSGSIVRAASAEAKVSSHSPTERVLVARQLLEVYNVRRRHLTEQELAEGKTPRRVSASKLGRGV